MTDRQHAAELANRLRSIIYTTDKANRLPSIIYTTDKFVKDVAIQGSLLHIVIQEINDARPALAAWDKYHRRNHES